VHHEIQFEVPLSGLFEFSFEDRKTVLVKPGTTFVIPPETQHQWRCLKTGTLLGILVSMVPSPEALTTPIHTHISRGLVRNTFSDQLRAGLLREFILLRNEIKTPLNRLKAWIFLLIDELLNKTVELPEFEDNDFECNGINRGQRIASYLMRYIEANINGDLSLKNLGQHVGLSSRQVQRVFAEVTGVSCHKYIMDRRVEAGRNMMHKDPSCSIKEIAYSCGFSSPAHFCVTFKKAYGSTPSEYRQ
jgi:AraC family transcriptional regulator